MFGFGKKKKDVFDACFGAQPRVEREAPPSGPQAIQVSALAPVRYTYDDGDKFWGGFGATEISIADYWTLRARSAQLFETNLYARGLIRRLVTNEINTGLNLEATPEEKILGVPEDGLADWAEDIETRFALWGKAPYLCDFAEAQTFGAIQAAARGEALICGDVLVTLRQHPITGLPRVQLISGNAVQSPFAVPTRGNKIVHGVELDSAGRQVAYWIRQDDGTTKRLPAYGEKSGRRLAWLVYGTDKRLDEVRGKPILALVLQSLKEIDRYRDSVQRKAVINSMIAMFIKKTQDKPGSKPITGGAVRRGVVETAPDASPREFKAAEYIPGLVLEELQVGEEPQAFNSNGTDEKFADFEEAIIQAVAWANELPPEILRLSFSSNYAASQAAINEFKTYLNKIRTSFGESFCSPIYEEFLLSGALAQRIEASGFLESFRDLKQFDTYGAWISCDWAGNIKPAVDVSKLVKGYKDLVAQGWITNDRASRELTGTKFSKNVQKLRRENEALALALTPIVELEKSAKADAADEGGEDKRPPGRPRKAPPAKEDDSEDDTDNDDEEEAARAAS